MITAILTVWLIIISTFLFRTILTVSRWQDIMKTIDQNTNMILELVKKGKA